MPREIDIPAGRHERLFHLGKLAGGMLGGAVAESFRQLGSGNLPIGPRLLLTPANAKRLADRLSEMRGAAMKVGQLLSMEGGDLLPREFTDVLARLRDNADPMPMLRLVAQLERAWGSGWEKRFDRFHFQPLAAASIGQVHKARLRDGRVLAVKVQYPGVAESIDSDVDNVATLLKLFRLVPEPDDLSELMLEAKRQLHEEADYTAEARYLRAYRARAQEQPGLRVPDVVEHLTGQSVLAMEFVSGEPIESLSQASQDLRNSIATRLIRLFFAEVFHWGLVQTDANFSNYRYLTDSGDLGLLDFGATRHYSRVKTDQFRCLLAASIRADRSAVMEAAEAVGYLGPGDAELYRSTIRDLIECAAEPARASGPYDFSKSSMARRMSEQLMALRLEGRVWRMPPPEILFLHRKLVGLYMICTRLGASVDVARLVEPYLCRAS